MPAAIHLRGFLGKIPAANPRYLPDHNAQEAVNVQTWYGSLRPIRAAQSMLTSRLNTPPAQTIFRYDSARWFEFAEDADVTRSPVPNDAYGRAYFTTTSLGPRVTTASLAFSSSGTYPAASYAVGVPTPPTAPTATPSGSGSITELRYYVYTAVNIWGEEGAPSAPSNAAYLSNHTGASLTFSPVTAGDYAPISKYRIYRTNSFGTAFQFIAETEAFSYIDTKTVGAEPLVSTNWTPPSAILRNLLMLPNGVMAASSGNQLRFSEPGLAHAWPTDYAYQTDFQIVALAPTENGLLALTDGDPYLFIGGHPGSMVPVRVHDSFACVSKRGVARFGASVIYPAAHGFVSASAQGVQLISDQMFDEDHWNALNPSTFVAFNWRNRYVGLYLDGAGQQQALIFDPRNAAMGIVNATTPTIGGVFEDRGSADVYVSVADSISRWATGSSQSYTWKSKPYEMPMPYAMRVLQVQAEEYPVTVNVYRDGELQDRVRVADRTPHRVRNAALGKWYEMEVVSSTEVFDVALAPTIQSIQRL